MSLNSWSNSFGADLDTLTACRVAEDDYDRAPPGRDRRFVVFRLQEAQDLWREGRTPAQLWLWRKASPRRTSKSR